MKTIHSLANHLLIAMPSLQDPFFTRSVIYICEHNEQGALGITLNLPLEASYQELFEHLKSSYEPSEASRQPLLAGGPVDRERGFILHSPVGNWQSSLVITDDIALTTSEDILISIANHQQPNESIIALGYAGWTPGQLEKEIEENSWLFVEAKKELLFHTPAEDCWQKATQVLGIDWGQISGQDGHA